MKEALGKIQGMLEGLNFLWAIGVPPRRTEKRHWGEGRQVLSPGLVAS